MSPLVKSLLATPQRAKPTTAADIEQALAEALLCSDEPGSLTAEPFVSYVGGHPHPGVRAQLHGVDWVMAAPSALTVAGKLIMAREPRIAQRQQLRMAWETLSGAARTAALNVLAARQRGPH